MFIFIGGLGTTHAYAAPWMQQLARLHGELFYFIRLEDASIKHLCYILESVVLPWCYQCGERATLVGYSAGCSLLMQDTLFVQLYHTMLTHMRHMRHVRHMHHMRILLIDPPNLFPAWAMHNMPSTVEYHPSYQSFQFAKSPQSPNLLRAVFSDRHTILSNSLHAVLSITARCSLARWMIATGWCLAERWETPWTVNADILRLTLPQLRKRLMDSILRYPAYPRPLSPSSTPGIGIMIGIKKHVWASSEKKNHSSLAYETYASLLAERSPMFMIHHKRGMDHHMLVRHTRYLYM